MSDSQGKATRRSPFSWAVSQLPTGPRTVRYRLRQVEELFGDQLRDPDRRFELHLALRIRTLGQ